MKFIFKTVIIAILIVAGITYANYLKTGRFVIPAILSKPELSMPEIKTPSLPNWGEGKNQNKIAYKWLDQKGNWQYTSEPPKGGLAYEKIESLPATK